MRAITKNPEPASLTKHRKMAHADYENYVAKGDLRQALVIEQRGLCCYCMGRIRAQPAQMKIEHWRSQAYYPNEQLNYRNLLGACLGEEGQPVHLQHCDTRKGNSPLKWNPANPVHHIEDRIRYEIDGSVCSDESDFDAQLNNVLNLNLPLLKNHRKAILEAISTWWRLRRPVARHRILQKRNEWVPSTGELRPYSHVAVQWMNQKLASMP